MKLQKKFIGEIRAADGHSVRATLVTSGAEKLVVLAHGITVNREECGVYTRFAEEVLAPEFDSLRFDFRGHGESDIPPAECTVAGEMLDFMAVVRWVREQNYRQCYFVACSFGGSIALLSAAQFDLGLFAAGALWNPVINYRNTFIQPTVAWARQFFNQQSVDELAYREGTKVWNFTIGPRMTMELLQLRPQDTIWPVVLPLLVVHGDQDAAVPYDDAVRYCRQNTRATQLHTVPGAGHGFSDHVTDVFNATVNWFRQPRG